MKAIFTRKLWTIVGMEFRLTAANRAFVVITLLGPFLIVALSVLPSLLSMGGATAERNVAIAGGEPVLVDRLAAALAPSNVHVTATSEPESALDARVVEGGLHGYVALPPDLLGAKSIVFVTSATGDYQTPATLQAVIGGYVVASRLAAAGVAPDAVGGLLAQPAVETRRVTRDGEKRPMDFFAALFSGLAFTFLLYMTVLLYGQAIGRSVVLEKTSKTVEIMLSSVRPRELLFGKILGKGSAGLLQYAVWIVMAVLVLKLLGPVVKVDLPVVGGARTMGSLVAFFLMAFFLYSSAYAALGAASEDEQHLGQLAWPLIVFLVVPMVFIGATVQSPDGPVTVALSLFPLTAPIVMFQRVVLGSPPAWQVALAVCLILATTTGVVALSARIFRVGILMTGKRPRLREVLRWVGYR
jgi:ABC-2 type transport system permease protein